MSSAFLVLDIQNGGMLRMQEHLPKDYLKHLNDTITVARSTNIPIIYVTICFRPGYPEISSVRAFLYLSFASSPVQNVSRQVIQSPLRSKTSIPVPLQHSCSPTKYSIPSNKQAC
jgi:nicotinamidase-related amidase